MSLEDEREVIKAKFYKYSDDIIMETYSISKENLDKILEKNQDYMKELEERDYA